MDADFRKLLGADIYNIVVDALSHSTSLKDDAKRNFAVCRGVLQTKMKFLYDDKVVVEVPDDIVPPNVDLDDWAEMTDEKKKQKLERFSFQKVDYTQNIKNAITRNSAVFTMFSKWFIRSALYLHTILAEYSQHQNAGTYEAYASIATDKIYESPRKLHLGLFALTAIVEKKTETKKDNKKSKKKKSNVRAAGESDSDSDSGSESDEGRKRLHMSSEAETETTVTVKKYVTKKKGDSKKKK